jgi:hypothetical protein
MDNKGAADSPKTAPYPRLRYPDLILKPGVKHVLSRIYQAVIFRILLFWTAVA